MNEPITAQQDHDRRIGRLEGLAEQLDRRLDGIERAISELRQELAAQGRQLNARLEALNNRILWVIGTQIALMGLLFAALKLT